VTYNFIESVNRPHVRLNPRYFRWWTCFSTWQTCLDLHTDSCLCLLFCSL